jgi:hypothetical protein
MGAVYRARDRELEVVVALEVIKRELAALSASGRSRPQVSCRAVW